MQQLACNRGASNAAVYTPVICVGVRIPVNGDATIRNSPVTIECFPSCNIVAKAA
jgi:hypothetical protein